MFWKKRQETGIIVELDGYAPYSGFTPIAYQVPTNLVNAELRLDKNIKQFLSKTKTDEFSGGFYDRIIDGVEQEATDTLMKQKAYHEQGILQMMENLFQADLVKCNMRIEDCSKELNRLNEELVGLEQQYAKYNRPIQQTKTDEEDSREA